MLATMTLKGIHFHAFHGAMEVERELGQVLEIDLSLAYDVQPSRLTPSALPPVQEPAVFDQVQKVVMSSKYYSLEGLALEIARKTLQAHEVVQLVTVVIRRKQLFIPGDIRSADVELTVDREDLADL